MHVARVTKRQNGREYTSYLLRNSYREGAKVKHQTLANISQLPAPVIELIRGALAGEQYVAAGDSLTITRSWPHGHVAAILGTARKLGLEALLDRRPSRQRDLVLAMLVGRVLQPASKLATVRLLETTSLGRVLGLEEATDDELYGAMDWLLERQPAIEQALAKRHLEPGGVVLYDLSSTYLEGTKCPLAKRGYSRDGRPGMLQIEFGLLTSATGQPVAIEVFPGNVADPTTVQGQVAKVQERFGLHDVVFVADRGMLTATQIGHLQEIAGMHWISALRAPAIKRLVAEGHIQLSLFDTHNLAEVADPDHPGERLIVCHNPLLAAERKRKREELLVSTEKELARVAAMVARGAAGGRAGLRGAAAIGERVGRVVNKYQVAKHFTRTVTDTTFSYERNADAIAEEAALDGLYVLRTDVAQERLDAPAVVLAYKSLGQVERAFRHFKLTDLELRPVFHYTEPRVRAHVFLCLLAYYVQREMERALAPLLFRDEAPPERPDPVAPAPRSDQARRKDSTKRTADGFVAHSFRTLLANLGTIVKNRVIPRGADERAAFDMVTLPTAFQARAFELLGLSLGAT